MAKKKREEAHGGHGWFVTFADLMALLLAFFVMLVAFSTQDSAKLKIVAGSMRDAFGVQTESRYSGIVEADGLPTRPNLKNIEHISPEDSSNTPTPDEKDQQRESGARLKVDREFVPARGEYGAFDLSADRANVVRQILEREGLPTSHIFAVGGRADSQPLFPDDPTLPANRRVTITLMRENPPLPPNLKP